MTQTQHITVNTEKTHIDKNQWKNLENSTTASIFQTEEMYDFYASLPEIFIPFVVSVEESKSLKGIIVGYITKESSKIKHELTKRAIIIGGPMLSDDYRQVTRSSPHSRGVDYTRV